MMNFNSIDHHDYDTDDSGDNEDCNNTHTMNTIVNDESTATQFSSSTSDKESNESGIAAATVENVSAAYYGVARMPSQSPSSSSSLALTQQDQSFQRRNSFQNDNDCNDNNQSFNTRDSKCTATSNEKQRYSTSSSLSSSALTPRPGSAVSVPGFGPGSLPSWVLQQREQRPENMNCSNNDVANHDSSDLSKAIEDQTDTAAIEATVVDEDVLERLFRERISVVATSAITINVDQEDEQQERRQKCICIWVGIIVTLTCLVTGLIVGFTTTTKDNKDDEPSKSIAYITQSPSSTPSLQPTQSEVPTIQTIRQRNYMVCSTLKETIGFHETFHDENTNKSTVQGFYVDLCRAIAAAIFGKTYNHTHDEQIEYTDALTTVDSLNRLASNKSIDVHVRGATITMERDVYLKSAGVGFTYTIPYLYDGITMAGVPEYVECADSLKAHGEVCSDLKICVCTGCTHNQILRKKWFPSKRLVPIESRIQMYRTLGEGGCNVIADERPYVTETVFRKNIPNYTGLYATGTNLFSKEPLAIVTREDDTEWSTFCNWILHTLMAAEKYNITQTTATSPDNNFPTTPITQFGQEFNNMSLYAIQAVGNYGEIYERNLERLIPRDGLDFINTQGDTGLIYSFPTGDLTSIGPGPTKGGSLEAIIEQGYLVCGIGANKATAGFGEYDSTNQVWSGMDADLCRAVAAGIFGRNTSAVKFMQVHDADDGFAALSNGTLDIMSGADVTLKASVGSILSSGGSEEVFSFSPPYFYSTDNVNDSPPIALATRKDDCQWSDFVRWVVFSTFYAEENSITNITFSYMPPEINLFGTTNASLTAMFQNIIDLVGNYGQMYDRNLELFYPRNGTRNMLNKIPLIGPQHFPLL